MLTNYGRKRVRLQLAASGVWVCSYVKEAAQCELCPTRNRIFTRTKISGTYSGTGEWYICNRCLSKVNKRREREHDICEKELYLPLTVRKERAAKRGIKQQQ